MQPKDRIATLQALARACAAGDLNEARQLANEAEPTEADADALLFEACIGDRVQIVQWLVGRFGYANKSDILWRHFGVAVQYGGLGVARWMAGWLDRATAVARARAGEALYVACVKGHLEVANWLVAHFGLGRDDVRDEVRVVVRDALGCVCENGDLDVAVWLANAFGLTAADARAEDNCALRLACGEGHLEVAQWLAATFGLGPADARASNNEALRGACEEGYLEVAQWLADAFGLGPADARANDNEALRGACAAGHLAVAQWLAAAFGLTAADARSCGNSALREACNIDRVEVVAWLVDTFGLGPADFHERPLGGLGGSVAQLAGSDVAQWLAARWPALDAAADA